MLIDTLKPGEKIQIHVQRGTNTLEFSTEAIQLTSNMDLLSVQQLGKKLHARILPVKLITDPKTNTAVSFPETNIIYRIYAVKDKTAYIWRRISISRLENSPYHILVSAEEGQPTNRRSNPRVSVGLPATARFLNGAGTLPVTIKNISGSGVALVTEANVDSGAVKSGFVIQDVTFTDPELNMTLTFSAFVVRITKYTNGRIQYACKLNSKALEISGYVSQKLQRLQNADSSDR